MAMVPFNTVSPVRLDIGRRQQGQVTWSFPASRRQNRSQEELWKPGCSYSSHVWPVTNGCGRVGPDPTDWSLVPEGLGHRIVMDGSRLGSTVVLDGKSMPGSSLVPTPFPSLQLLDFDVDLVFLELAVSCLLVFSFGLFEKLVRFVSSSSCNICDK